MNRPTPAEHDRELRNFLMREVRIEGVQTFREFTERRLAPAAELGIPSIWINRLGEPEDPRPRRTLTSLTGLADALDGVVPR